MRIGSRCLPLLAALGLASCGSGGDRVPDLAGVPMLGGAQIVVKIRSCDPGANASCAFQLVVVNHRFRTSQAFLDAQRRRLRELGWTGAYAPNGDEHAVDSPGGRLHLIYATPDGDLIGIDFGWIKRRRAIALALSHAIFAHTPTLSMLVQFGSS